MNDSTNTAQDIHYILNGLSGLLGRTDLILTRNSITDTNKIAKPLFECVQVGKDILSFKDVWDCETEKFVTIGVRVTDGKFETFSLRSLAPEADAASDSDRPQEKTASFTWAAQAIAWLKYELRPSLISG